MLQIDVRLLKKAHAGFFILVLGALVALLSVILPWYSISVLGFGLNSHHTLTDEYLYWASLSTTDPKTAQALHADTKMWIAASVPILVVLGVVIGLFGIKWRTARLFGAISIVAALVVSEYFSRPFAAENGVLTTPYWGFYACSLSALLILIAFLWKNDEPNLREQHLGRHG
jgi:hypothetical protein